jgi:hypothetical protein
MHTLAWELEQARIVGLAGSLTAQSPQSMLSALKGGFMATAKEVMVGIIQDQPEDSSFDELLRELAIKRMVDRGLDDARKGKTITNEDMERRIRSWQK